MNLIFLDTEYNSSTGELAQLSYISTDGANNTFKNFYFRVSAMDEASLRIHHLSKDWPDERGTTYLQAAPEILHDFTGATLAAHNLNADKRILEKAFGPLPNAWGLCTMYRFARVLRLPGGHPYKMPSLRELMAHYGVDEKIVSLRTHRDFDSDCQAHDARWDAEAVRLCLLHAMARGDCRNLLGNDIDLSHVLRALYRDCEES